MTDLTPAPEKAYVERIVPLHGVHVGDYIKIRDKPLAGARWSLIKSVDKSSNVIVKLFLENDETYTNEGTALVETLLLL